MNNKIVFALVGLVVVVLIVFFAFRNAGIENNSDSPQENVLGSSLDVVSPFYNAWLDAVVSTTTDPYLSGLANDERLTEEVKAYITAAQANTESSLDPVLCQNVTPPRVGAKLSYEMDGKAQYLMLARGAGVTPEKALVSLEAIDGAWKITKIECVSGEEAPVREFSFEREGFILRGEGEPLDPNLWYIVFEENGQAGHTAPLFFGTESLCSATDAVAATCDPAQFTNPSQALVKGQMTESGVDVKQVEFF